MTLRYYKISSYEPVCAYLCLTISRHLASGKKVLWLVTGGSSMPMAVEVSKRLQGPNLKNLSVTLTDERWGPVGHPDSNWQQLQNLGFKLDDANLYPVLQGKSFEETVDDYNQMIKRTLSDSNYKIGFIGIGADGHAGGIQPGSPAVTSKELVVGYNGHDFRRLTLTPKAIIRLDEVVTYAVGEAKHPVLGRLEHSYPLIAQPVQAFKRTKKFSVFNDIMGDSV